MAIQFLDALAGAGKTRALSRYAMQLAAAGEHVLFIQPTKQLIDATIRCEFRDAPRSISVAAIHGGNTRHVKQAIIQHSKASKLGKGAVLFITHAAFMRLSYLENQHQWHLIFDEVPTVDVAEPFNIAETHRMITDALCFSPHDAAYGIITAREGADIPLRKIARNPRGDENWGRFKGLVERVLSPHWDVFALQSNYHGLLSGDGSTRQLVTHSLLRPSIFAGFKQVILASALFTESTLYKLWTAQGVQLKPVANALLEGLRYRQHGNGALITIRYLTDRDWSKTLRDKPICLDGEEMPRSLRDRLPGLIGAAYHAEPLAWMGNADMADDYLPGAIRLPNSPHGLNGFQHLHHVAVLSALNATPSHFRFMETRGIAGEQLRTASYRSAVYQAAMRISIRDPGDLTPKSITVMDAATAHWLSELFPGCRVETLSNSGLVIPSSPVGRPRQYDTEAERVLAHRCKNRHRRWLEPLCSEGTAAVQSFGTAYASVYDKEPLTYLDTGDVEAFIQLLRDAHSRVTRTKHHNFLLSPAHFIPNIPDCDTRRGLANVQHVNGIWLDNDGGDLSHADFAQLFPQLRMVVWNTYSSTAEYPRWRCFIPTTAVLSVEEHARLVQQIVIVLKHNGFNAGDQAVENPPGYKCHGFDTGKFNAASIFYAPCQASNPESSFFVDYRGGKRHLLDVSQWLENDIAMHAAQDECGASGEECDTDGPQSISSESTDALVSSAINRWRGTPRGQGHDAIFRLACDLRRLGMDRERARHHLVGEARNAHSPLDRIADVQRILPRLWG